MHILYLTCEMTQCPDSLSSRATHALARMAQREGHQVEIVTAYADGFDTRGLGSNSVAHHQRQLVKGVPVTHLTPLDGEAAATKFANWIREQEFDIVHGVFTHSEDWPFALSADSLPSLVITLIGLPSTRTSVPDSVARSWMRHANERVAPSAYAARQWQDVWPGSSFRVIPCGVDLLALIEARQTQMSEIAAESSPSLLCIGLFDQDSGVLELLNAFSGMAQSDLRMNLIGTLDEGTVYGQSLIDMISSDSRIHLTRRNPPSSITWIEQPFDTLCLPGLGFGEFSMLAQECAALNIPCFIGPRGQKSDEQAPQACVQFLAASDAAAWTVMLAQSVKAFDRAQSPDMGKAVPLRIEEESFFYEGIYRRLTFKRAHG